MSNGTSTTTIREFNAISPELKDYFTGFGEPGAEGFSPGLLGAGQQFYAQPYSKTYEPYLSSNLVGGNRVAPLGTTESGQQFYQGIMGLQRPGSFDQAGQYTGQAAAGLQGLGGLQVQGFGSDQAQQYMSPYAQAVTDVAKRKAMEDAQRSQLQANLGAGRKGSLGSSGQILATTERERQLGQQLGDIQARGLQDAYTNAQTQFERDRTAQLEAARQRASAFSGLGALGAQAGQLGTLQQAADIDRLKVLGAYSDTERGLEQQRRDFDYQDIMRRVQYPEQQLMGMSSLLRGTPMGDRIGTTSATTPPPSFLSQLTGAGLTGLSLYNLGQPRRD